MKMTIDSFLEQDKRVDTYGNFIHDGDIFIVDMFKQKVIHSEFLLEYFYSEYQDLYIQLFNDDHELYEYIRTTYECGVFTR